MAGGNASMTIFIGGDNSDFLKKWEATKRALRKGLGQDALATSESIATGLAAAGAAMAALGIASIKLASDMQANRKAFAHLMGDTQQAEQFLNDLARFAADTPFEMAGLTNASKRLLAFGFAAQDIIPMMAAVGDAVALMGGGQEAIDGIVRAIGQIQAKGKLSAEEINQLAERNINAWKYVAEELGVSIPEAMKLTEKGAVDSTTAINGLIKGMQKEFRGGMEGLSKEIPGMLSTLKDNATAVMREMGDDIIEALDLKQRLQGLVTYLGQFADYVKNNGINEALRNMIPKELSAAIFVVAGALVGAAIPAVIAFGTSLWTALVPLLPFIGYGAALGAVAWVIWQAWQPLGELFGSTWTAVVASTQLAWAEIKSIVYSGVQYVLQAIQPLANLFGGAFQTSVVDWMGSVTAGLADANAEATDAAARLQGAVAGIGNSFAGIGEKIMGGVAAFSDTGAKLNTTFTGLTNTTQNVGAAMQGVGSATEKGASQAERAWEQLVDKAKQVSKSIEDQWVQTTKTELQQLDLWLAQQLKDLEESQAANENYQRDLLRLEAVYSIRRKKIMEEEAKTRVSIWDKAADAARSLAVKIGGLGLTGVSRERYDIQTNATDGIEEMRRKYRDWAMEYQAATKEQQEIFRQAWVANGIQFSITEQGMVDFSRQMAAEKIAINAEANQKIKDLHYERVKFEEDLERARNDGEIETFKALLQTEQALMAQDLEGRKEYMDAYYEIWKGAHRSAMSYMGEMTSELYDGFKDLFSGILDGSKSIGQAFADLGKRILKMITDWVAEWLAAKVMMGMGYAKMGGDWSYFDSGWQTASGSGMAGAGPMPSFAGGGTYGGGFALVGEKGPEIIHFNRAGHVFDADETRNIIDHRAERENSSSVIINMNINTPNAESFRQSQSQLLAAAYRNASMAQRRNG